MSAAPAKARRLVLDASAAVRLVMRMDEAEAIAGHLEAASLVLAPTLYHAEVANALWQYVGGEVLDPGLALERLTEAQGLLDLAIPDVELATEALGAATQHGYPVYELLYAVTARRHGCAVLTLDRRMMALLERMGVAGVGC